MKDYMGILNLNEKEDNIKNLTRNRTVASIPVAGRYRVIDFVLSNMVNAGIQNIGVFTKSKSRSLMDHIGGGKPWDLDRKNGGLFVFNFGYGNPALEDVEMFRNNIDYLQLSKENNVILSSSYMICNIDYEDAVRYHEQSGNDITIIYKKAKNCAISFLDCDVLNIDENNRVTSVGKNIGVHDRNNICMEMFIMKKKILIELIYKCVTTGACRKIKHAIYRTLDEYKVGAYEFKGYLTCINSIQSYYNFNLDCLDTEVSKELFFNNGLIYTKVKDEAPTRYVEGCKISNSLVANGCIIEGEVENSVISRRVRIKKGAKVKNCIIMQNCVIGAESELTNIIIDKNVTIGEHKKLKGDNEIPLVIEKVNVL
ncbi:MAG: glucose-1-phosphate adenylyltransferase subunit GlgD [Clostridiales bacterium]|uniref:glucose-1-phosphate adenylyltransferase subunit GlgD n=1 Tax=Clostridium sp. N3C TaxID=1776758 RepID=UPI00092DFC95|nr:glucose-1-phosphate adenylyltransferase subunit GlgD [Clostridium sp. N3C]NLZ47843.1 glucose-1-phosphate adenylyltransferase subunit GlgD [Clostridiales bacterium]SCN26015.1 Glycogen biosynthesis protein GlgD [Clostridium sp. N3C]